MNNIKLRIKIFFAGLFILALVVGLAVSLVFLYLTRNELNTLQRNYADATLSLNKESEDKSIKIEDLTTNFKDMTAEISRLREENNALKQEKTDSLAAGFGNISGSILPFVSQSADFSQYQMVCAVSTTNSNEQYCRTVSSLSRNYSMSLPAGSYFVTAQIFPRPASDNPLAGSQGVYNAYVKCVREQGASKCDSKIKDIVEVKVAAGAELINIDPIDWTK